MWVVTTELLANSCNTELNQHMLPGRLLFVRREILDAILEGAICTRFSGDVFLPLRLPLTRGRATSLYELVVFVRATLNKDDRTRFGFCEFFAFVPVRNTLWIVVRLFAFNARPV